MASIANLDLLCKGFRDNCVTEVLDDRVPPKKDFIVPWQEYVMAIFGTGDLNDIVRIWPFSFSCQQNQPCLSVCMAAHFQFAQLDSFGTRRASTVPMHASRLGSTAGSQQYSIHTIY